MKKQLEEYNNLKNILLDKLYKVIDGELKDKDKVQRIKKEIKHFVEEYAETMCEENGEYTQIHYITGFKDGYKQR